MVTILCLCPLGDSASVRSLARYYRWRNRGNIFLDLHRLADRSLVEPRSWRKHQRFAPRDHPKNRRPQTRWPVSVSRCEIGQASARRLDPFSFCNKGIWRRDVQTQPVSFVKTAERESEAVRTQRRLPKGNFGYFPSYGFASPFQRRVGVNRLPPRCRCRQRRRPFQHPVIKANLHGSGEFTVTAALNA